MSVRLFALAGAVASALAGAACTVGAPPGFSSGDSWAFPLVGPLEDGVLLVPVTLNGKGPYLFQIDSDAPATSIDESLAGQLGLYGGMGPHLPDESDTERPTKLAEIASIKLGNLTVVRRVIKLHKPGSFVAAGRELAGIIGRDILADSLVFAFDRDAGMGYLATRDVFTAPDGAIRLSYQDVAMTTGLVEVVGATRRLVTAQVNGTKQTLHVDLGGFQSQLRSERWADAHLTPLPYRTTLVDELGTPRAVDKAGIANQVTVGGASGMGVLMVPYGDRRTDPEQLDGTLGLNFFAPYHVWADWSGRAIYLKPREDAEDKLLARLGRWASPELAACKQPGCVTAARLPIAAPSAPVVGDDGEPVLAPVEIEVQRDPSAKELVYEVTLEAIDADGLPMGLPRLVATLPRGVTSVRAKVSPVFAEARFRVVDVSPFVRICKQAGGCVLELALRS